MPIRRVDGGWQWGYHGSVYPTRFGAVQQARAAYAHGYVGNPEDETMHECPECGEDCGCEQGEVNDVWCEHCPMDDDDELMDDYADEERRGGYDDEDGDDD